MQVMCTYAAILFAQDVNFYDDAGPAAVRHAGGQASRCRRWSTWRRSRRRPPPPGTSWLPRRGGAGCLLDRDPVARHPGHAARSRGSGCRADGLRATAGPRTAGWLGQRHFRLLRQQGSDLAAAELPDHAAHPEGVRLEGLRHHRRGAVPGSRTSRRSIPTRKRPARRWRRANPGRARRRATTSSPS